jgi:hypothetical protein
MSPTTNFDRTTSPGVVSPGVFSGRLDESGASLGGILGGYMAALTVRAVEAVDPDRAVRTVGCGIALRTRRRLIAQRLL